MEESTITDEEFWNEVQKRRNMAFMWLLGSIVLYPIFSEFTRDFFEEKHYYYIILLMSWLSIWCTLEMRLRRLICPDCGLRAFRHCWFFMKNAECRHCGFAYHA